MRPSNVAKRFQVGRRIKNATDRTLYYKMAKNVT